MIFKRENLCELFGTVQQNEHTWGFCKVYRNDIKQENQIIIVIILLTVADGITKKQDETKESWNSKKKLAVLLLN